MGVALATQRECDKAGCFIPCLVRNITFMGTMTCDTLNASCPTFNNYITLQPLSSAHCTVCQPTQGNRINIINKYCHIFVFLCNGKRKGMAHWPIHKYHKATMGLERKINPYVAETLPRNFPCSVVQFGAKSAAEVATSLVYFSRVDQLTA